LIYYCKKNKSVQQVYRFDSIKAHIVLGLTKIQLG